MKNKIETHVIRQKSHTLVFAALVLAGLAGNYFKFSLFLNIDFLFGSIFSMLALQLCGQWRGVIAATIIASYTYVLWNHPYAIIVAVIEVSVVGALMSRHKFGAVWADGLFWLCIGMPLLYLFYHLKMELPPSSTFIVMVKQSINGISNVLIARIIYFVIQAKYRNKKTSLGELFSNLLTAFLLFPALIMIAMSSRSDFQNKEKEINSSLQQKNNTMTNRLSDWVDSRASVVVTLTNLAKVLSTEEMQLRLEQALASDKNFARIGMRDTDSVVAAYAPPC